MGGVPVQDDDEDSDSRHSDDSAPLSAARPKNAQCYMLTAVHTPDIPDHHLTFTPCVYVVQMLV